MKKLLNLIKITRNDLDFIKSYIEERHTAILVIMFTDIVGFTRLTEEKGENYAATLRKTHDDILTNLIEKDKNGKVIKYIGDSVMAVFSEPTKAVETALLIQNRLDVFNKNNSDFEDINVRIGLHMGQVAIENRIASDIFGRHVNRASRIESLAGKSQVYLSYPVFDSAKGWLQDMANLGWKSHGEYFLKGIDKPEEIIEVFDKTQRVALAPKKGKKKRVVPSFIFLIAAMILGSLITAGVFNFKKTEVYLFDFVYEDVRTLNGEKIFLDGNDGDNKRLLLSPLEKGRNVLYYDVSAMVRYYSEIDVQRGENLVYPSFKRFGLPDFEFTADFSEYDSFTESIKKTVTYYNQEGERVESEAVLNLEIKNRKDGTINNYRAIWDLQIDGKRVGGSSKEMSIDSASRDYIRDPFEVVVDMEYFNFEMRYMLSGNIVKLNCIGVWK